MTEFYVSIIFVGITLILVALVWILYDRKRSHDYLSQLDAKKTELVEIINDAEQMVQEMNKFSDYMVTQMELKNEEMGANIRTFEERIKELSEAAGQAGRVEAKKDDTESQNEKAPNGNSINIVVDSEDTAFSTSVSDLVIDSITYEPERFKSYSPPKPVSNSRDNVIPINSKHKDVIRLAQSGMNETEIAKKLKIGKGEVQLILGLNK